MRLLLAAGASYLPFGPLSGLTFGNGINLTRSYDQDYRLTGLTSSGASGAVQNPTYAYNAAGNVTGITDNLSAARNQTFAYDNLNRLASASGLYGAISYSYDGVGNRLSDISGTTTETFGYPINSNQLLSVTAGTNTRSFSYLASGQLIEDMRTPAADYTFAYNKAGRMAADLNPERRPRNAIRQAFAHAQRSTHGLCYFQTST